MEKKTFKAYQVVVLMDDDLSVLSSKMEEKMNEMFILGYIVESVADHGKVVRIVFRKNRPFA